jgi:large conductance mechanosensitive channel
MKKGMIQEFKEFIARGSVLDLAVGIIVGSAFTSIVTSLVNDILMPLLGLILGKINLTDLKWVIKAATDTTEATVLAYGNFIQNIINFLVIAFTVFLLVKGINTFRNKHKKEEETAKPAAPAADIVLLTEIRDLLKK